MDDNLHLPRANDALLVRAEEAGINASAPPQQLWQDGWLVRFCPGKAKRARCVNALAPGRLPLDDKLRLADGVLARAGLPLLIRVTPWSHPHGLDALLAGRGWTAADLTQVLVCDSLSRQAQPKLPTGMSWVALGAEHFAAAVGALRGSSLEQQQSHAQRLQHSPVPYRGYAIVRDDDGAILACGQFALEGAMAGLYDIFTALAARGQGLACLLCQRLLQIALQQGATAAYLQVENDNNAARRVYARLGFREGYAYHYRLAPPSNG